MISEFVYRYHTELLIIGVILPFFLLGALLNKQITKTKLSKVFVLLFCSILVILNLFLAMYWLDIYWILFSLFVFILCINVLQDVTGSNRKSEPGS